VRWWLSVFLITLHMYYKIIHLISSLLFSLKCIFALENEIFNQRETLVISKLWGNFAQQKQKLITSSHHYIIKSPHQSPFSAHNGFFGSRPYICIVSFNGNHIFCMEYTYIHLLISNLHNCGRLILD
jgi:hypothetical protein